jgi:hypothetical protein
MSHELSFKAVIENPGGGGAFVRVPFDVELLFGKKRLPVNASIDGEAYRGTLVKMGEPCHVLIVLKEIRERIGKSFGDEVTVTLVEDLEPRVVAIPADLRTALEQNAQALSCFDRLSYTHQKEYVTWISSAKQEHTRQERIIKTIAMLCQGKRSR